MLQPASGEYPVQHWVPFEKAWLVNDGETSRLGVPTEQIIFTTKRSALQEGQVEIFCETLGSSNVGSHSKTNHNPARDKGQSTTGYMVDVG